MRWSLMKNVIGFPKCFTGINKEYTLFKNKYKDSSQKAKSQTTNIALDLIYETIEGGFLSLMFCKTLYIDLLIG